MRTGRRLGWRMAVAFLGLACVTSGCAKKDPIKALLAEIEEAAEHRDARKVVDHLAPEFLGQGRTDRAEALRELRRYFVAYESVSLTLYDIHIERAEGAAEGRVRLQVDFDGRPLKIGALSGFLPPSAAYRFDLRVRDGGEGWLVSEATWEDVTAQVGER